MGGGTYQRANYKKINEIDLEKADTLIRNRNFKNKMDLYKLLNANNLDLVIADYFIFYKKTLGV